MAEETSKIPGWIKALAGLVALVFVANAAMLRAALGGRRDLVRTDYYDAGLAEDARRERLAASAPFDVAMGPSGGTWSVELRRKPGLEASGPDLAGTRCRLAVLKPDDRRLDRVVDLAWADGGTPRWVGAAPGLRKGHWEVTLTWERDGRAFMEAALPWNARE
jgi:hypothetical protein